MTGRAPDAPAGHGVELRNSDDTTVEGLEFEDVGNTGLRVTGSNRIAIRGCTVFGHQHVCHPDRRRSCALRSWVAASRPGIAR